MIVYNVFVFLFWINCYCFENIRQQQQKCWILESSYKAYNMPLLFSQPPSSSEPSPKSSLSIYLISHVVVCSCYATIMVLFISSDDYKMTFGQTHYTIRDIPQWLLNTTDNPTTLDPKALYRNLKRTCITVVGYCMGTEHINGSLVLFKRWQ